MKPAVLILIHAAALCLLLCAAACACAQEEQPYSRVIEIEGVGAVSYYAQNDPLWAGMIYEAEGVRRYRTMLSGGCAPATAAIVLSSQLETEELVCLLEHTSSPGRGFPFCACSVNEFHRDLTHESIRPTTPESLDTYLPIVLAAFATGNNERREKHRTDAPGTALTLFRSLCEQLGLTYLPCATWEDARTAMEDGYSVVTTVMRGIFTGSSHYLYLAGTDGDYLYILDTLMRDAYPDDVQQLLEVVEPGLVRVRLHDVEKLEFSGFYAIKR